MMLVSIAGPAMNIFVALVGMLLTRILLPFYQVETVSMFIQLLEPLILINLILAVFNLIPLPPLDGSKILAGFLSDAGANTLYSLEQYGPLILLLLILQVQLEQLFGP